MSDFDLDGLLLEPRPDEDAWEAFLNLAFERMDGARSPGLTNRQIGELESVIGTMLPFEVGLMLVMGVPTAEPWRAWDQDPEAEWASWNAQLSQAICVDVEHNDFWFDGWGPRPSTLTAQLDQARDQFASTVPALFPIYGHHAVPLTTPKGHDNSDGNPVFSVHGTEAQLLGDDLAAWMHKEFEIPLPMWPSQDRTFAFWSELAE